MDRLPKPHIVKINNLKCIFVNLPCSNITSAGFFVKIGSAYEPDEYRGISHFLEHMLFKKNTYSKQMTNKLDELGISYNAATSREHTYYECHGNTSQTKDIIFLLFMIFTQALFIEKDVTTERQVIFEEMNGDKMNYKKQLFETIFSHVFKNRNENYALPIIGNVDSLNNINSKVLKEFFNTYYHYDNSVFVVVGNINYNTISAYVKKLVNKYPRSGIKTKDIQFIKQKNEPTMILKQISNSSQTTMIISFYIKEITEIQKIQLFLLNHILTGNFMSILFNELRVKKGLCYGVNSDSLLVKTNNNYSGIFFIKINSDPNKIKECLKLILLFIMTKKINKTVYLNSKKSLDNTVSFSFQTSKDYLYFFGSMLLNDDKIMPSKIINILKKTSLNDINNLLNIIKKGDIFVNMMGAYQK